MKVRTQHLNYSHKGKSKEVSKPTNMPISKEEHPFVTCAIEANEHRTHFIGTLSYKGFENGKISGSNLDAVRSQFDAICTLIDNDGGMLRRGTIMLGYHNNALKGDVLSCEGENIGYWEMEEEDDWSHFIPEDQTMQRITAPSAWLLQDSIADWVQLQD